MSKPQRYLSQIVADPVWFLRGYYSTAGFMSERTDTPIIRSIRESKGVLNKLRQVLGRPDRRYEEERQWEAVLYLCRYPRLLAQAGWDAKIVSAWIDFHISRVTAHARLRLAAAGGTRREPKP